MILEYEKGEWIEKGIYVVLAAIGLELVLWGVLAAFGIDQAYRTSWLLVGLLLLTLAILYLLARLLYRGYLILTKQEWKSSHAGWALAGVRRTRGQERLKEIASHAPFWGVRMEAVSKISDSKFLQKIILKDTHSYVCEAAWNRTSSYEPEFLKEVVRTWPSYSLFRARALSMISDPDFLKDIALKDADMDARLLAIEKLMKSSKDQTLLKDFVSTLTDKVKNGTAWERKASARVLETIYKRYPIKSISNKIRALNGILIYESTPGCPAVYFHVE
ncbi:MAG: hypothetical protein LBQ65_10560 [Tannerellaceae bacterium]|jgi:hypothetical protein|nr:hypothetical protein [Tannerellaceae bacterium]